MWKLNKELKNSWKLKSKCTLQKIATRSFYRVTLRKEEFKRGRTGPLKPAYSAHQWPLIFVISFYPPSCFGQETAKKPFGLRVKLPRLVHKSTTHWGVFTMSLFLLNAKQGIEPRSSFSLTDARPLIGANFLFLHPTKTSLPNSHHKTLDWLYVIFFCEVKKIYIWVIKKTILLLVMHHLTQI